LNAARTGELTMNANIHLRLPRIALFALLTAACATSGSEPTSSRSSPIVLGTPDTAHPEAVLVDLYQGGTLQAYCSGVLVAPYVVLTAGHCVDGYDTWEITAPGAQGATVAASASVMLDWQGNGDTLTPSAHDVGLVILPSPIGLPSYPTLAQAAVPDGTPVINVGRVQDGTLSSTTLYDSIPLEIRNATPWGWDYDYLTMDAVQAGDSGGPDYWVGPSGPELVAINSGATKNNNYELLARIDLVAAWIQSQIAAYPNGSPYAPPDAAADAAADGSPDASSDTSLDAPPDAAADAGPG
jgi:hypothetical protein